jgi:hypothetical protein
LILVAAKLKLISALFSWPPPPPPRKLYVAVKVLSTLSASFIKIEQRLEILLEARRWVYQNSDRVFQNLMPNLHVLV